MPSKLFPSGCRLYLALRTLSSGHYFFVSFLIDSCVILRAMVGRRIYYDFIVLEFVCNSFRKLLMGVVIDS
jgi:hypothetical protein